MRLILNNLLLAAVLAQESCVSDPSYADITGDGCEFYDDPEKNGFGISCGLFDGADSSSNEACCGCDGGSFGIMGNMTMPATECMDDMTWTDNGGDDCGWYVSNADSCGSYGDGAWDSCCACGGGSDGMTMPDVCQDDYSWTDNGGDDCDWYYSNSGSCGSYGEGAYDACCACGGGNGGSAGNSTGEVCQDEMWTDNGGDDCSWYYSNSGSCGSYGDGAWDACCACGGGSGSSGSSTDGTDQCMDDYSWSDTGGDDCDWYYSNAGSCGSYGEGAYDACCACGGGMGGDWTFTGECYDDMGWYDDDGDDCSFYQNNPNSCGDYGEGAYDACCACGGGMDNPFDSSDYEDECQDDYSWTDNGGDDCDWYYSNAGSCGSYGEGAWDACCACGGGDNDWDYNGYDNEPMDWEWYLDEASDLLPQEGQSWSLGPVTVTYDAASKLFATFGAAIMATAIAY